MKISTLELNSNNHFLCQIILKELLTYNFMLDSVRQRTLLENDFVELWFSQIQLFITIEKSME